MTKIKDFICEEILNIEQFIESIPSDLYHSYEKYQEVTNQVDYEGIDNIVLPEYFLCTIQIPSFKRITFLDYHYVQYGSLTKPTQFQYLSSLIDNNCLDIVDRYQEFHKDGRVHVHFTLKSTPQRVKEFQDKVCKTIGIKSDKQKNEVFNYKQCVGDIHNWKVYITKQQQEINQNKTLN